MSAGEHAARFKGYADQVTIFWLFTVTNLLFYLSYRLPPLFIAIFNMNLRFCERRVDIRVVTHIL